MEIVTPPALCAILAPGAGRSVRRGSIGPVRVFGRQGGGAGVAPAVASAQQNGTALPGPGRRDAGRLAPLLPMETVASRLSQASWRGRHGRPPRPDRAGRSVVASARRGRRSTLRTPRHRGPWDPRASEWATAAWCGWRYPVVGCWRSACLFFEPGQETATELAARVASNAGHGKGLTAAA